MKTEGVRLKCWYNYWPVLMAVLIPIFNVETITIAMLTMGIKSYSIVFTICAGMGVLSFIFWYKFARWFLEEADLIKQAVDFMNKNFQGKFGARLIMSWVDRLNKENKINKKVLSKIEVGGKIVGHVFVFVAALNPVPFLAFVGWFPCVIVCGWIQWKKGLAVMILGDIIKNSIMTYLWLTYGPQLWNIALSHLFW